MINVLNQEVQKPVYLMSKSEMIEAVKNEDPRSAQICKTFYINHKELISKYC